MRVSSWKFMAQSESDIECPFGLNLGKNNRDEYFRGLKEARVQIEGNVYTFSLDRANFWTTCPELRDKDVRGGGKPIRDLFNRLDCRRWTKGKPRHFNLELVGGIFVLSEMTTTSTTTQ